MPASPQAAEQPVRNTLGAFGVAVNGVLFESGAGEFWRGDRNWQYEALSGGIDLGLDQNNAHVQPGGIYHYHGLPVGLLARLGNGQQMVLLGYAADGFPIYAQYGYAKANDPTSGIRRLTSGYQIKSGQRPGGPGGSYDGTFAQDYEFVNSGDLDPCNGRFGVTPDYPEGTYYYCITDTFPYISREFRGTPNQSFRQQPPAGGPSRPGSRPDTGSRDRPPMRPPGGPPPR
ncbi:MAG: YHYH protein [Cyanobacteria bacterium P01_D01_bin.128]